VLKFLRWCIWGFVLLAALSTALNAQTNFVYTNNDLFGDNSVSAFSVDASGSLSELTSLGSPFLTGGLGTASSSYSPNRIIAVKVKSSQNDFLYASNAGGSACYFGPTVSAFKIDANSGALSLVLPLPDPNCSNGNRTFPTDGFDGSPSGTSLAATPDGTYLYAGTTGFGGTITIFSIDPMTGALSKKGSVAAGGPMSSMKITPQMVKVGLNDEYLLAVALPQSNQVAVFEIKADGTLAGLSGSPFSTITDSSVETGLTPTAGIDINCASNLLFAGRSGSGSPYIDVFSFSIDSSGALPALTVTDLPPFKTDRENNQVVVLSHPDDSTLFSSNPTDNTVTPFAVDSGGKLTQGTAVGAGTGAFNPGGLALSQLGEFLYAGNVNAAISTFIVDSSSSPASLTVKPVTSTGLTTGLHSVAAYPANVCSTTSGETPKLTITKTLIPSADPRRFNLQINGTTLATNVGDGGSTGAQDGVIGSNTVGETIATPAASLSDFTSVIGGDCAADGTITLAADDNKTCTITNTRNLPTLTSIDPAFAYVGGSGFPVTLTGTNFGADSKVQFNGSDLTTTFDGHDTTHLTADIPASDLTKVGQFPITVHNSLPTVGSSNSKPFTVNYKFLGLFEPYASGRRHYRVNSTIPLKWQYATADGTPAPSSDADPVVKVYPAACDDGDTRTGDLLAIEAAGNSGYHYHSPSMTWQFNWKTGGGMDAGCYVICIKSELTGQTDGPFPIQLVK
jgi:Lactonase, 7-bladed beta-propeller